MVIKTEKIIDQWISTRNRLNVLFKKRSIKYGLPFLLFVVGGSFGLRQWTQIRLEALLPQLIKTKKLQSKYSTIWAKTKWTTNKTLVFLCRVY
jgi:hypothetical protein